MKIKKLLPIALMATALLIGCGGGGGGGSQDKDDGHHNMKIDNVAELEALWYNDGSTRMIQLTMDVDGVSTGAEKEIALGKLTVTSSDSTVIEATGLSLKSAGVGTALISVKWYDTVKSLELTITKQPSNKDLMGTDHEGTADDPFSGEDAIKAAKYYEPLQFPVLEAGKELYISGKVQGFYHKPGTRTTQCSWFYEAAEETAQTTNNDRFEAYCINILDDSGTARDWVESDIAVGQTAVIKVSQFAAYKGQYETAANKGVVVSISGSGETIETHEVTVAEAMTVAKALGENAVTKDLYQMTGKVIAVTEAWSSQYGNVTFSIGDTADTAEADRLLVYRFKCAEDAVPAIGATITVKGNLKNHKLDSGNAYELTDPVAIGEYEHAVPVVVDPTEVTFAEAVTLAKALEDGKTSTELYKISGYVIKVTYAWKDGTMSFLLGGAADTAEADCLTVFKLACDQDKAPAAGAQVVITGNLQNYVKNEAHTYEVVNGKLISSQSGGEGGEGGGGGEDTPTAITLKITKSNSGVGTDTLSAAKQVEYDVEGGKVVLEWSAGCFDYGNYDEIGVGKNNGYVKLISLPASKIVDHLELDFYQYENAKVYATADGTGNEVVGTAGTASGLNKGVMKNFAISGSSFSIVNPTTYNQAFYSITIVLAEAAA